MSESRGEGQSEMGNSVHINRQPLSVKGTIAAAVLVMPLCGCGTYVPELQENPFASEGERSRFVQAITRNIRCELQDAVVRLYKANSKEIDPQNRNLGWFDSWAAQVSLTLTIDEKTELNPVFNWLRPHPASALFNLNLGATLSSDATRIDKIGYYFLISDFKRLKACAPAERPPGPFLLQSDLKLYDWLYATMITNDLGDTPFPASVKGPNQSNVISHQVKFVIVTSAGITPGWKLTRAEINQSGTFLDLNRTRTQDLTITLGPPDPDWPGTLGPAAARAALASELHNAITTGVRGTFRP